VPKRKNISPDENLKEILERLQALIKAKQLESPFKLTEKEKEQLINNTLNALDAYFDEEKEDSDA